LSTRRQGSRQAAPTSTPAPAENGNNGHRNSVNLGPNDRLVGQLFIEGDLRVAGTVEGEVEATGDVEITGSVKGAVTAYNRLTVGRAGSLIGSEVRVSRLTVEDGATFTGKVSMGKVAPTPAAVEADPAAASALTPGPAAESAAPVVEVVARVESKPKKR
jgi:cytoskeletal protein CcmA (bactofilin family)